MKALALHSSGRAAIPANAKLKRGLILDFFKNHARRLELIGIDDTQHGHIVGLYHDVLHQIKLGCPTGKPFTGKSQADSTPAM